nr:SGNH hydrolase domain-containing protein [Vibrio parahaemolyticus]
MKNTPKKPTLLLLGNSFANQLYPGFINNKNLKRHTVLSIGTCGFDSEKSDTVGSPCYGDLFEKQKQFINKIIKEDDSLEYIIIDGLKENQNKETIDRVLSRIKEIDSLKDNINFIVFYPHIKIPFHPANCYRRNVFGGKVDCSFNYKKKESINVSFAPLINELEKYDYNIRYFDQNIVFCESENSCSYTNNGIPLYRDSSPHTSEYASIKLQEYFNKWLISNEVKMF